jgi:adenylate cyclase
LAERGMSDVPREIERKFLVAGNAWLGKATSMARIEQGYLARGRKAVLRVRIRDGKSATLTIKSRERGISRAEFEYKIPLKHARALMELCGKSRLQKERYSVPIGKLVWEVDVFTRRADGLVLAEIELDHEDQVVKLPKWIGEEVTDDPRYRNSSLADEG